MSARGSGGIIFGVVAGTIRPYRECVRAESKHKCFVCARAVLFGAAPFFVRTSGGFFVAFGVVPQAQIPPGVAAGGAATTWCGLLCPSVVFLTLDFAGFSTLLVDSCVSRIFGRSDPFQPPTSPSSSEPRCKHVLDCGSGGTSQGGECGLTS